jgi:SAM-dependent methyltransferase
MSMTDAPAVRDQQRTLWDHVSAGWQRWQPRIEVGARVVSATIVEMAGIGPGDAVLDIGSGVGEPALSVARAIGPAGRLVGVDLSPAMVAASRRAAAGINNVEFVIGDLETTTLPVDAFDAAVSRWGLMFAADRIELLRAAMRWLKPGRRLAAAVWGPPAEVPAISLAFRVISEHLALPPPQPGPGPFSMADPDAVVAEFEEAGFVRVEIENVIVPFRFESVDEFVQFSRDVLPPGMKQVIHDRCGTLDDPGVWNAVSAAAAAFAIADNTVALSSRSLCLRAVAGRG